MLTFWRCKMDGVGGGGPWRMVTQQIINSQEALPLYTCGGHRKCVYGPQDCYIFFSASEVCTFNICFDSQFSSNMVNSLSSYWLIEDYDNFPLLGRKRAFLGLQKLILSHKSMQSVVAYPSHEEVQTSGPDHLGLKLKFCWVTNV